jgi:hypothetical protein
LAAAVLGRQTLNVASILRWRPELVPLVDLIKRPIVHRINHRARIHHDLCKPRRTTVRLCITANRTNRRRAGGRGK